jgi:hypothetical protein
MRIYGPLRAFGTSNAPLILQFGVCCAATVLIDKLGGAEMIGQMISVAGEQLTLESRLWRVVIARSIQDWLSKPLRAKREAEQYLFNNSADLAWVCESAGIKVELLRNCLNKVRGRTLCDVLPVAA